MIADEVMRSGLFRYLYVCILCLWNDMDGAWAEVSDWSYEGIAAETGLMFTLNRLVFSAGISSISFSTASVQLGFGITF